MPDRPTFHESWYRVAHLRPRLSVSVQSYRQHFRGRRWHVLRDRAAGKFYRLSDAAYHFVGLLDGDRTVNEAWLSSQEHLGDRAPTQGEAIATLGQLYSSNLLAAELPPDAAGMLERRNKRIKREVRQYLTNILFAKIPLWDPDRFLDRWTPVVGWCFGPVGVSLWIVLLITGLMALAGRTAGLQNQVAGVLAADNLFWLYLATITAKAVHELGHGVACKRFGWREDPGGHGGEVHTLGIMLLVLIPVPYVDASSAWGFRSKWRRAAVGAAGMYAELALAAAAAIVWSRSPAGTALHAVAFNTIFIAGVSTLLFNINPLIRFDGYYILSDLFEVPNLATRATQRLQHLVRKHAYGVKRAQDPARGRGERVGLTVYGIAALIYRVWLSVVIVLFVADKLFFVGMIMAGLGLVGWVLMPLGRFVRYLAADPELLKVRRRAVLVTVVPLGLVLGATGLIPVPEHGRAQGVIEPARLIQVYAGADGFVQSVMASRSQVRPEGPPLVVTRNRALIARRDRLIAQLQVLRVQHRRALTAEMAEAQAIAAQIEAVRDDLTYAKSKLAELSIKAPFEGVWLCGDRDRISGGFVQRGEAIGVVATLDDLWVRVTASQFLGPRLARHLEPESPVAIRIKGQPNLELTGRVTQVLAAGQRKLPSAALGIAAGGQMSTAWNDRTGKAAAEPFFEIQIQPATRELPHWLYARQRVVARFELPASPLLVQAYHSVRQLLQQRFHI